MLKIPKYTLRKSINRRTISIVIGRDLSVRVLAPLWCPKSSIEHFLHSKAAWIEKKLGSLSPYINRREINSIYENGSIIWYLGAPYVLSIIDNSPKKMIEFVGNTVKLHKTRNTKPEIAFKNFFIESAKVQFQTRLEICFERFYQKIKCTIPKLKIRFMKTRWGSMSSSNLMTLNAKLIFAEYRIIDYVIMHELCHIKHKNHQSGFYDLFAMVLPDYREVRNATKMFFRSQID